MEEQQSPPVVAPPGWVYQTDNPELQGQVVHAPRTGAAFSSDDLAPEVAAAAAELEAEEDELAVDRQAPRALPELVHAGTYALYLTPAGNYHLTYRRNAAFDPEAGEVRGIDGAPEVHCRDLPEHAAAMVGAVLDRGQELPPMLTALLFGGNPLAGGRAGMIRQLAAVAKEAGGIEQLMDFAQQNGGPPDAVG